MRQTQYRFTYRLENSFVLLEMNEKMEFKTFGDMMLSWADKHDAIVHMDIDEENNLLVVTVEQYA